MRCTMNEETRWAGAGLKTPSSRDPDLPAWSTALGKIVFDGRWYKLVINYRMYIVLYYTTRHEIEFTRPGRNMTGVKQPAIRGHHVT